MTTLFQILIKAISFVASIVFGYSIGYFSNRWLSSDSKENSQIMSPATVSVLFPDRPIRPLPRRRLRERLSPELARSIKYPPSTHDIAPLFYYPPFTVKEEVTCPATAEPTSHAEQGPRSNPGPPVAAFRNGIVSAVTDEEEPVVRGTLVAQSPPEMLGCLARNLSRPDQIRPVNPPPPPSAASSVDGYESFENTNNKKKRKIPSAGDSAMTAVHSLNSEIGSLVISAGPHSQTHDSERPQHGSFGYPASNPYALINQATSGSGRGRLGRPRNGRSPLRALADGNSTWPARSSKTGGLPRPPVSVEETRGIISSAIAKAEKLPQGQENVSLLHQHSMAKTTPASTQFTFTCDSQVTGMVQWPGQPNNYGMGSQATSSTSANGAGHSSVSKAPGTKTNRSRKKSRRRLEQELNLAARHRRQIAAENYYHHPPRLEDLWICEFCEYERIFGEPPRALIRDYEIKDRRHRQEEADRKRLLEKAKAKSRKGKKSGKATSKSNHGAHHAPQQSPTDASGDQDTPTMLHGQSHSTQSEEDEYEDDYGIPVESLPARKSSVLSAPHIESGT